MPYKVSICMIPYNHEKYISQAIDSILSQKTKFDYQIVIGEDCSTDKTREIVTNYKEKYPDKIRLILHENNIGMHHNFANTLGACDGQYIAILESDDYWINPEKLQKQIDFLDENPDFSYCFHDVETIFEEVSEKHKSDELKLDKDILDLEDLLIKGWIAKTASIVLRNHLISFENLPPWFYKVNSTDYTLQILLAEQGKIKFLKGKMAAYRRHPEGRSLSFKDLEFIDKKIDQEYIFRKYLSTKYKKKYNKIFRKRLAKLYFKKTKILAENNMNFFRRITCFMKAIIMSPPANLYSLKKAFQHLFP